MSSLPLDIEEEDSDEFETDVDDIDVISYDDIIEEFNIILENTLPWEDDIDGY